MTFKQIKSSIRYKFPFIALYGDAVKRWITSLLAPIQRRVLKSLIKSYHAGTDNEEILQVMAFLDRNCVQMIPYAFVEKYNTHNITVLNEEFSDYPYVNVNGNKVYFPKEMLHSDIRKAVNAALTEQDVRSPHCYNAGYFTFHEEGAGVFIGASDGIYCLSVLEHFSSVFLFEADQKWQTPLSMTFAPWKEKVIIIQKFVSDRNNNNELTLDTFSSTIIDEITYLQADVEGAEKRLLIGAQKLLLRENKLKLSLCCYHRHNDCDELGDLLRSNSFSVSYAPGYLIMWMQVPLHKPYLRRGVIYADKRTNSRN
jgi:hypothetical protein